MIIVEPDRRAAIALALGEASPGDVVVIAGKGHERYQEFADQARSSSTIAPLPARSCGRSGGPA